MTASATPHARLAAQGLLVSLVGGFLTLWGAALALTPESQHLGVTNAFRLGIVLVVLWQTKQVERRWKSLRSEAAAPPRGRLAVVGRMLVPVGIGLLAAVGVLAMRPLFEAPAVPSPRLAAALGAVLATTSFFTAAKVRGAWEQALLGIAFAAATLAHLWWGVSYAVCLLVVGPVTLGTGLVMESRWRAWTTKRHDQPAST